MKVFCIRSVFHVNGAVVGMICLLFAFWNRNIHFQCSFWMIWISSSCQFCFGHFAFLLCDFKFMFIFNFFQDAIVLVYNVSRKQIWSIFPYVGDESSFFFTLLVRFTSIKLKFLLNLERWCQILRYPFGIQSPPMDWRESSPSTVAATKHWFSYQT